MFRIWLSIFVLIQLSILSASRLLTHGGDCGGHYCLSRSDDPNGALCYVDGKLVDRIFFCNSVIGYNDIHCLRTEYAKKKYCRSIARRESVEAVVEEGSRRMDIRTVFMAGNNGDGNSSLKPKMLAMGLPTFLIFCCVLLCPCFQSRKRDSEQTVLTKVPSSSGLVSSLETNSPLETGPGSPQIVPPSPSKFSMSPKHNRFGAVHLSMSQVVQATHNFSPSRRLGGRGFGAVYKAELPNGQVVVVKRARKEHFEALKVEFRSEVELLAKINHHNLVKLLGYVEKGSECVIITEYVPNGTLRKHLDGIKGKTLDFNQRLEISIDVAHGLTHLHLYAERQVIHRDIKSSNILLTESYRAKVADFGFARAGDDTDSEKTHVSTKVKGTVGYLDPEYMRTFKLTAKSDVYSFGILLLEILTGRRPVDTKRPTEERVTIKLAFRKYKEGRVSEMVDPAMNEHIEDEILVKLFGLAIRCAAPTRADRPDMKAVGEQLWAIRKDYRKTEGSAT